jgi:glucose-6-phosphate 1-dehydrogenase
MALRIIIFGASGDLTQRKLIPALYQLAVQEQLPPDTRIIGVSRSALSDEQFRARVAPPPETHSSKVPWSAFARQVFYVRGDVAAPGGLERLQETETDGGADHLYYLALAPQLYGAAVQRLGEAGMNREAGGWRRLVIEKPFGRDLASARELHRLIHQHFHEDQVYRIDHYLGKETVQNLLVFRFANVLFEPVWNRSFIDHVQITVAEKIAVEGRGDFYDQTGVLRDMFQNHLLQLLTLVAMEAPARFEAGPFRNEKIKLLDAVEVPQAAGCEAEVVSGQYEGYQQEKGVRTGSKTPTFAALRLHVDNWRWQGVPFYLRSGKGLAARSSEIVIQFHCPPHLMFPLPAGQTLQCNRLALCIQPDEGIHVNFQTKVPGQGTVLRPADLEFHYQTTYGDGPLPEAYERLVLDAINGDATLFMRNDEIERAWAIMDPLIAAVEKGPPPQPYPLGSDGPACADALLRRDGRSWLSLCHHAPG